MVENKDRKIKNHKENYDKNNKLIYLKVLMIVFTIVGITSFYDAEAALMCKFNSNQNAGYTQVPYSDVPQYDYWENVSVTSECMPCTGRVTNNSPCGFSNYSAQYVVTRDLMAPTRDEALNKCRNSSKGREWRSQGFDCAANPSLWYVGVVRDPWRQGNQGNWYGIKAPRYTNGNVIYQVNTTEGDAKVKYIYYLSYFSISAGGSGEWLTERPGQYRSSSYQLYNYKNQENEFKNEVRQEYGSFDNTKYEVEVDKAGASLLSVSGIFTSQVKNFLNKNSLSLTTNNFSINKSTGDVSISNFYLRAINGSLYGQPVKSAPDLWNVRQRDYWYWIPFRIKLTYNGEDEENPEECVWQTPKEESESDGGTCDYNVVRNFDDECILNGESLIKDVKRINNYCYLEAANGKYEEYDFNFVKEKDIDGNDKIYGPGWNINWTISAVYTKEYTLVIRDELLNESDLSDTTKSRIRSQCRNYAENLLPKNGTKILPDELEGGDWIVKEGTRKVTRDATTPTYSYTEEVTYRYKDQYVQVGTGLVSDTQVNKINYIKLPEGHYKLLATTAPGKYSFKVSLSNVEGLGGGSMDCPYKVEDKIKVIWRPISLQNPFPGFDGSTRESGINWSQNDIDTVIDETGYDKEPIYEFELGPSEIASIRRYNNNHEYSDFTLRCNKNGEECRFSDEIRSLLGNSASGTCWGTNADFENCRN